ncbi:LysR family substrate-binding domain-containing protein [Cryobacterium psychrophilum]|uniref:LysR family transcriptional regulator n=1 Tax=Cryobacterium psychrophilum TaxID=41988 RepID=A0A4Y8KSR8_9MICO|nr:LysR family substrate-binding domain-containing protein [Cryobacterium psychrophilum]TDW29767.1 LysR substrate binding domain-containing protein [Cryobacterium psychrophilum]TFD81867.1 LysR family transcriptional regulator [Cryobacterium psychrophilum]
MSFSIAFVAGVTPTKWTRIWAERRPEVPLEVFRTETNEQVSVLLDGRAEVSLVRLPIDENQLSVIGLYSEVPVVVAAKGHEIADADLVALADLADEHLLQDPDEVPAWRDMATEVRDGIRRALPVMKDMDEVMEQVAAGVGIIIVPHSIARLHGRKDVISRPVDGVPETQIALAWITADTSDDIEEFIGIVRGRSSASSRATVPEEAQEPGARPPRKPKKTDKAKAAAKALRVAAAQAKPAAKKKSESAPGRTRPTRNPRKRRS